MSGASSAIADVKIALAGVQLSIIGLFAVLWATPGTNSSLPLVGLLFLAVGTVVVGFGVVGSS